MVFCYKIITDTPRRSGHESPRRQSPVRKVRNIVPSSLSQLVGSVECENESVLDEIPEREWRLLAALARKKEDEVERAQRAGLLQALWERERAARDLVEAETTQQYRQYLQEKRRDERSRLEFRRLQLTAEERARRGLLLDCIRDKELRSQEARACTEGKKASEMIDRVLLDEARSVLAAERRLRHSEAERCRRQLQLAGAEQRARGAERKRTEMLKDSTKRLAVSNALSSWESALARHARAALEEAARAQHAERAARGERRAAALAALRERRAQRARRVAALAAQMRADLRAGRGVHAPAAHY